MKKYLVWLSTLVVIVYLALQGALQWNSNSPGESMSGLLLIIATLSAVVLGILGTAYYFLAKRHQTKSSTIERILLSICIAITVLVPLLSIKDFGLRDYLVTTYVDRYSAYQIKLKIRWALKNTFIVTQLLMIILFGYSLLTRKSKKMRS